MHYWQHRKAVNSKKTANIAKQIAKKDNSVFFASQILQAPARCENCNEPLRETIAMLGPRAIVAHIVPKRSKGGCPSVSLHPLNRWFGCKDCHANYDNKGSDYVITMFVLPIVRERFAQFKDLIAPSERKNIPKFLKGYE